jgi:hypothetical protein
MTPPCSPCGEGESIVVQMATPPCPPSLGGVSRRRGEKSGGSCGGGGRGTRGGFIIGGEGEGCERRRRRQRLLHGGGGGGVVCAPSPVGDSPVSTSDSTIPHTAMLKSMPKESPSDPALTPSSSGRQPEQPGVPVRRQPGAERQGILAGHRHSSRRLLFAWHQPLVSQLFSSPGAR